jgi:hypothetical protein
MSFDTEWIVIASTIASIQSISAMAHLS